jgi:hypothetical protein
MLENNTELVDDTNKAIVDTEVSNNFICQNTNC